MRTAIVHEGARRLQYEIREIVEYGHELQSRFGVSMTWENIGDPIACGEKVAPWIRDIVRALVEQDSSWAYCHSRGVLATREFLAAEVNKRGGCQAGPEDILFFNGLADAVDKIYDLIRKDARVLMPSPTYSTHSSNEAKRGDYARLQFPLDPARGWAPDLDEVRHHVKYNPQIVALAIVNPDNPTGMVYSRQELAGLVDIARHNGLFLICDEIYAHIAYQGQEARHLSEAVEDVPALALRGISKDYPWPGSRCAWMEMLNRKADPRFGEYCQALVKAKMMEVCSTTLPQMSVPLVYGDPRISGHFRERAEAFRRRAVQAREAFADVPEVLAPMPKGAFYVSVVFREGVLNGRQTLPLADAALRDFVAGRVRDVAPDKRFVYYLMASAGICVTPLSGFATSLPGFRLTTLHTDDARRQDTLRRLKAAIGEYVSSAP